MSDDLKPPVAIRITRPYDAEEQFLEREFDTLTRTSVILLGAQPRPQGVVLRFEIVLKSGASILRGEGRVVGYKERAYGGEPGLTLRFTRLDSKSKVLVDKAAALREARVRASTSLMSMPAVVVPRPVDVVPPSMQTGETPIATMTTGEFHAALPPPVPERPERRSSVPAPPPSSRRGPPPLPAWAKSAPPPPLPAPPPPPPAPASAPEIIESVDLEATRIEVRPPVDEAPPEPAPVPRRPSPRPPPPPPLARPKPKSAPPRPLAVSVRASNGTARAVDPPAQREALLERLRARRRNLSPEALARSLEKRASGRLQGR